MQEQLRNVFNELVSPMKDLRFQRHMLSNDCVQWERGRSLAPEQVFVNIFYLVVDIVHFVSHTLEAGLKVLQEVGVTEIVR